ncbi:hypothetical protein [Streptomyces enissocaesilis]|uniref:Uncharacterized protein n=1 Tax=Streptomyces enissocaesilis TaxID=332589 RepID=A0ABP6J9W2_9ACTN
MPAVRKGFPHIRSTGRAVALRAELLAPAVGPLLLGLLPGRRRWPEAARIGPARRAPGASVLSVTFLSGRRAGRRR